MQNLVETDGAISFSLSLLSNAGAFSSLFDKYRIVQAKVGFFPYYTEGAVTSGVTAGPLYTVLDYDDGTAVNINGLVNYDNLKVAPIGSYFERVLTPHAALAAYSGVFTSFAQAPSKQWIDIASSTVQYYGLKYATPASLVGAQPVFTTLITLELEFCHPR
jgi:hypothetical protein